MLDQQLREHPDETIRRLKAAGDWPAADKLLRAVRQSFRRRYAKVGRAQSIEQRIEMHKAAWDAVHDKWPPPDDAEPLRSLRAYLAGARGQSEAARLEMPSLSAAAEERFSKLDPANDPTAGIVWVFDHLEAPRLEPMKCPSRGAWTMLAKARKDPEWFYTKVYRPTIAQIAKQNADQGDGEYKASRTERMACDDMRRMLIDVLDDVQIIQCPSCGHGFTAAEQSFDSKWANPQRSTDGK